MAAGPNGELAGRCQAARIAVRYLPARQARFCSLVTCVKAQVSHSAHDQPRQGLRGGLTMQDLHHVTEDQAAWLRILERRHSQGSADGLDIPDDVLSALVDMGFVRRWSNGAVAITLGGIREVAQH